MPPRPLLWLALALLGARTSLPAPEFSNVDAEHALAWGQNIGWVHWRPDGEQGAVIGEFVCSGYLYSANAGWISLGNGVPSDGIGYSNASAEDFGVNHDGSGNLRGLAYGANLGWIAFEETGSPRVDLLTGELSGAVYGANLGWITLDGAGVSVRVTSLASGLDSDGDGIPDAWQLFYAGDLETLTRDGDFDGDGMTDYEEYLAGTNPMDPEDRLRITGYDLAEDRRSSRLSWTARPARSYRVQTAASLNLGAWEASGLVFPEGEFGTIEVDHPAVSSALFFRIEVLSPLRP